CLSTIGLRTWLEERRVDLETLLLADDSRGFLVRPLLNSADAPDPESKGELIDELNANRFEVDLSEETIAENTHRWLMADLLEFHKRERAVDNYEWVAAISMEEQQFIDDSKAIGGLELLVDHGSEAAGKRSKYAYKTTRSYRFDPSQATDFSTGSALVSPTFFPYRDDPNESGPIAAAKLTMIDTENGLLDVEISSHDDPAPPITSGFPTKFINKKAFETALEEVGRSVLAHETDSMRPAHDMLNLRRPRFRDGFDLTSV
ncbi:MAG: hypothetical protein ACKOQZ_09845, partial [Actinomycetota bacterium]